MNTPYRPTIFEHMSQLAQAKGAINLGQGFPDFPEPPELIEAATRALRTQSNQYPPMRGLPALRQAIAGYYRRTQALKLDANAEIVVTSGATEALAATLLSFVQPGDEVILIQPAYDAYRPLIERAGGIVRYVDLQPPEWTLPLDRLEAAITERTRVVILNTPNNPTGTVLGRDTLEAIGALCERHDLLLVCDEVWEGMIYDGAEHVSPMRLPSLRNRTVKIGSAGKIFSMTGWKIGWACAAAPLASAIATRHQFLTFSTATPLQWAVAECLELPETWHEAHRELYAAAKRRFVERLEAAGFVVLPASGSWFVNIDLAASGLPTDDVALSERMIDEAGVASIPFSAFYADREETGHIRLCFAKGEAVLDTAVERLAAWRESFVTGCWRRFTRSY